MVSASLRCAHGTCLEQNEPGTSWTVPLFNIYQSRGLGVDGVDRVPSFRATRNGKVDGSAFFIYIICVSKEMRCGEGGRG